MLLFTFLLACAGDVSVGWSTTDADVDLLLRSLPVTIDRLRALGAGAAGAPG